MMQVANGVLLKKFTKGILFNFIKYAIGFWIIHFSVSPRARSDSLRILLSAR